MIGRAWCRLTRRHAYQLAITARVCARCARAEPLPDWRAEAIAILARIPKT